MNMTKPSVFEGKRLNLLDIGLEDELFCQRADRYFSQASCIISRAGLSSFRASLSPARLSIFTVLMRFLRAPCITASQSTIAKMAGCSRKHVNEALALFEAEGIVSSTYRHRRTKIYFLNPLLREGELSFKCWFTTLSKKQQLHYVHHGEVATDGGTPIRPSSPSCAKYSFPEVTPINIIDIPYLTSNRFSNLGEDMMADEILPAFESLPFPKKGTQDARESGRKPAGKPKNKKELVQRQRVAEYLTAQKEPLYVKIASRLRLNSRDCIQMLVYEKAHLITAFEQYIRSKAKIKNPGAYLLRCAERLETRAGNTPKLKRYYDLCNELGLDGTSDTTPVFAPSYGKIDTSTERLAKARNNKKPKSSIHHIESNSDVSYLLSERDKLKENLEHLESSQNTCGATSAMAEMVETRIWKINQRLAALTGSDKLRES